MRFQLLRRPRGGVWWRRALHEGFILEFVADCDALLAKDEGAPLPGVRPS